MTQPTEYKYINDKIKKEWGYEISYQLAGLPQTCRIICKPTKGERRGVYQTRTGLSSGLHSFYDARDEHDAGRAVQQMLEEALTEIRKLK